MPALGSKNLIPGYISASSTDEVLPNVNMWQIITRLDVEVRSWGSYHLQFATSVVGKFAWLKWCVSEPIWRTLIIFSTFLFADAPPLCFGDIVLNAVMDSIQASAVGVIVCFCDCFVPTFVRQLFILALVTHMTLSQATRNRFLKIAMTLLIALTGPFWHSPSDVTVATGFYMVSFALVHCLRLGLR